MIKSGPLILEMHLLSFLRYTPPGFPWKGLAQPALAQRGTEIVRVLRFLIL